MYQYTLHARQSHLSSIPCKKSIYHLQFIMSLIAISVFFFTLLQGDNLSLHRSSTTRTLTLWTTPACFLSMKLLTTIQNSTK